MSFNASTYLAKIGGAVFPPLTYPCIMGPGGSPTWNKTICPYPGLYYEYIHQLYKFAGVQMEVVPLEEFSSTYQWGTLDETSGDWDGMMGMLQRAELDTFFPTFIPTSPRLKYFDFLYDFDHPYKSGAFVTSKPANSLSLKGASMLYDMFQPMVWLCFGLSLFTCLCLLAFARNKSSLHHPTKMGTRFFWDTISMVFDQYNGRDSESMWSGKAIMFTLGLSVLFLHTLYEGYLVTMMLGSSVAVPFASMTQLAELVKQDRYRIINYSDQDSFLKSVQNDRIGPMMKMKQALQANPAVTADNLTHMLDMMEANPKYVIAGRNLLMGMSFIRGRCNLILQADKEAIAMKANAEAAPLQVKHYYGIICIWFIGAGLGLFFLVIENVYWKHFAASATKVAMKTAVREKWRGVTKKE